MGQFSEIDAQLQDYEQKGYLDSYLKKKGIMLEINKDNSNGITFPELDKVYDVTTNQGNVHKSLKFKGYSNGVVKPKYIFESVTGNTVCINPSYEVEMTEILHL
tara:strand:+ start:801 stop:1112 length:312 start_codon:yes stop_codon:yes gene_type:complete